jgi:hypothetical protein
MVEQPVPWIRLFRSISPRFPADTVRCQCGNVGLQFVLLEQIPNAQLLECQKKWACSSHLSEFVLPFLAVVMIGPSTETTIAWFLGCTYKTMSHYLWFSSKGILGFFQASLEGAVMLTWLSLYFLLSRQGMNLAAIWCICRLSSRMLWTDPDEIPNMLTPSQIVILLFSWTSSFTRFTLLSVLLVCGCPEHLASSPEGIPSAFKPGKPFRKLCSSHYLLYKTLFQHFEGFCSIFSQCKIWCRHAVISCLPFSGCTKIANGTTHASA